MYEEVSRIIRSLKYVMPQNTPCKLESLAQCTGIPAPDVYLALCVMQHDGEVTFSEAEDAWKYVEPYASMQAH